MLGVVVIVDLGSSSRSSSRRTAWRSSTLASMIEASVRAKAAPLLFRMALEPDRLLDVDVPVGSIVIIDPWIVH